MCNTTGSYEFDKTFYTVHNRKRSKTSTGVPECTNNSHSMCLRHTYTVRQGSSEIT